MVSGSNFMVDIVLREQVGNDTIDEVRTFIVDKSSRCPKLREDILFQEFADCHCIVL